MKACEDAEERKALTYKPPKYFWWNTCLQMSAKVRVQSALADKLHSLQVFSLGFKPVKQALLIYMQSLP